MANKIEYKCQYCGAKSASICIHCLEKQKLVRIIKKMGKNFLESMGRTDKDATKRD